MIKEAEQRGVDPASPFPDWGKPEGLMSLAYAHSMQTPPDLQAARNEAKEALKLVPDWSYIRDNLLPQLEQRLHSETLSAKEGLCDATPMKTFRKDGGSPGRNERFFRFVALFGHESDS